MKPLYWILAALVLWYFYQQSTAAAAGAVVIASGAGIPNPSAAMPDTLSDIAAAAGFGSGSQAAAGSQAGYQAAPGGSQAPAGSQGRPAPGVAGGYAVRARTPFSFGGRGLRSPA
jgi:hypothetical protein